MGLRAQVLCGDCLAVMAGLPDRSVHCCVTSPPYWGLRDYGTATWDGGDEACDHSAGPLASSKSTLPRRIDLQLGLEPTPDEYVAHMVDVFREVRRVLRDDGTLWLNLGDSYGGAKCAGRNDVDTMYGKESAAKSGLEAKQLVGIPWRVAFALQADGWYLRQDIIWSKPNPMPESVTDRCTKAHEYIFLLSKSPRYFYDAAAIQEAVENMGRQRKFRDAKEHSVGTMRNDNGRVFTPKEHRNRRSVWTVPTKPFSGAHFAVMPPDLVEPCILAGCPEQCCPACGRGYERITVTEILSVKTLGWQPTCDCAYSDATPGTVLDPFAGSGTVGMVAAMLGRNSVLIELNPQYINIINDRVGNVINQYRLGI